MVIEKNEFVFEGIKPNPRQTTEDILDVNGNRKALYQSRIDDFKTIDFDKNKISVHNLEKVYLFLNRLKLFLNKHFSNKQKFDKDMIKNNNKSFSIDSIALSIMSSFSDNPQTSSSPQAVHADFSPDVLAPVEGEYYLLLL